MNEKFILKSVLSGRLDGTSYQINIVRPGCCEVYLVSSMDEPEQMIAKVTRTYAGSLSHEQATNEDIEKYFSDQMKTKLTTPLEMLYFVFLVKNVSRALTHQLVRTRIASYAQESMRFLGHRDEYNILSSTKLSAEAAHLYNYTAISCIDTYEKLLRLGVDSEDARGVLPTNILTSIFVGISMKSLQHMYEQRMCCQAQPGEWQPMLIKMKETIVQKHGDKIVSLLSAPYERGEPCGYRASYDRPCVWSNKNGQ